MRCASRASGQISSSSCQGDEEGAVGEADVSAATGVESHSASLSHAREKALLRCLRAREAARAGFGDNMKGESEDIAMMSEVGLQGESR